VRTHRFDQDRRLALVVGLRTETRVGVGDLDVQLLSALHDELARL